MRLLFLNRSFWPDLEATGQLLTELCEDLSQLHEVTVIAGPSYYVATIQRGPLQRDSLGRVGIVRTWGTKFSKGRLLGRLLNLASYYVLAAIAALRSRRPDVVITETDPPLLGLLGALLKARWHCRLVYYCQDIFPEIAEVTGGIHSRLLLSLLRWANRVATEHADAVIVLGRDMERRLAAKNVDPEKIAVVPNWIDCRTFPSSNGGAFRDGIGDRFVVMYSGNFGLSQQVETVVEAAAWLQGEVRILFVLIGEGARKAQLEKRVRELGLANVRFLPYQPKTALSDTLAAADLHLIPLRSGAEGLIVPSKLYGILAAGRPFVAMMEDAAEVARVAREHGVGIVIPPGDAGALAATVREAASDSRRLAEMGARARRLAEAEYDRPLLTARFQRILEELR